ncbi:MAG: hypothetical protein A2219_04315 [Elusimicrobia bacterium RIFOXYA2_FULL_50_26]|nr:MAG: hypothetical protein A2219_04315 [Elusimicrobia bacterium RIFOXYA2_FULL_50_26]OGS25092.1 MAG: hypothetical protein A2314_04070 [Elusimicrobia bacterium RIFOXYB2_FULL_50_12]
MDGLSYIFQLISRYEVIEAVCMGKNASGENIYRITYARGCFAGTEVDIRNRLTALMLLERKCN